MANGNWTNEHGISKAKKREVRQVAANSRGTKYQVYFGSVEFSGCARGNFKNYFVKKNDNYPTNVDFNLVCEMLVNSVAQLNSEVQSAGNIADQRVYVNRNFDRIVREHCEAMGINPKIMERVSIKSLSANYKPVYKVGTKVEFDSFVSSASTL